MPPSLAERIQFALDLVDCPRGQFAVFLNVSHSYFSFFMAEKRQWPHSVAARAEIAMRFLVTANEQSKWPVNFHCHKKIMPLWLDFLKREGVPERAAKRRRETRTGTADRAVAV